MSDISFYREPMSSIVLIAAESEAGTDWLAENVQAEDWQYWGGSIACEASQAYRIMLGARDAGLEVE